MDWVAAVSDQKEWDHDGGWEELRKVLLSAPPSCVTASTKRSWSSGVQRNRGLGSAAEEEEFMTPASAERSPLLFLPYKLGRSWSCCWCAGDDVVDCCGRCSPGCCIKLPAGFAAVYFLIWYILDFTVKKQLHRSWIAAGGFNDQSSAWLVPEYGVFSCLEDQDLKSHQQFQVNLLRRPPEEVLCFMGLREQDEAVLLHDPAVMLLLLHVEAPKQKEREYQWCSLEILCWSWIMRQQSCSRDYFKG